MAMFREHVALGAIISMVVVVAVYFYALVTDPLLLLFLFGVTVVGSFLPDVDSDSGMPFYLIFGTTTLAATGMVLLYTLDSTYASDWRYLTGIPAGALIVFWFIVGGVVKRCTHHRGIFHSIPALAISGVGSFLVARHYGLDETTAWIFGGAMAAGYLCHLVLDEIHAGITIDGVLFNTKSSFGSALKFFSDSSSVNLATYLLLAVLIYTALQVPVAEAFYSVDAESASQLCCEDESAPFQTSAPGGRSSSSKNAMVAGPMPSGSTAAASGRLAFYNDSDVIEIIDDAPPAAIKAAEGGPPAFQDPPPSGGGPSGGGSAGAGGAGAGNSGGETGDDGDDGEDGGEDDLIDLLTGSGAFQGFEGLLSGSGGDGTGASAFSFFGEGITLKIFGKKVREALSGRTDLHDVLASWKSLRGARGLGAREYGLMAASTALGDENIQEISFTASAFDITYSSRGYMLSIFPWTFPVRVHVVPEAAEGSRVTVKLPWYRFVVREFFTAKGLSADIEASMKSAAASATADSDETVLLFEAVSTVLRAKVGTVSGSILINN